MASSSAIKESARSGGIDLAAIKRELDEELQEAETESPLPEGLRRQRVSIIQSLPQDKRERLKSSREWLKVGISGFDALLDQGIPRRTSILVCGGPGSGKTIFCLQTLAFGASKGERCLYLTFEESEQRLKDHMDDFGWDWRGMEHKGNLLIKRFNPFDVTRQVEAMLERAKGELLIDIKPLLFPVGFKPDRIVVDSLSAIAAAFVGKEETYRIYIEQLFKIFEEIGATSFLISESTDVAHKLTTSGVEEFLADGVVVLYNFKRGNVRENAVEVLKLRGAKFQKKIVAMQVTGEEGIVVYPDQEVFAGEEESAS